MATKRETFIRLFDDQSHPNVPCPFGCKAMFWARTDPMCPHGYTEALRQCERLDSEAEAPPAPAAVPTDWFALYLAGDKQARKQAPIARGLIQYFPNTCINVAHVSYVANEQHNPGLPMQWAFDKSTDEADCQIRHAIDAAGNPVDDDGLLHLAKKAWRAFAECERYLLEKYPQARAGASVTGRDVK